MKTWMGTVIPASRRCKRFGDTSYTQSGGSGLDHGERRRRVPVTVAHNP